MKTLKTAIIATIVTALLICSCSYALPASAEVGDRGEFYPHLAVVVGYIQLEGTDEYLIILLDKDGDEWAFYGEEEDAEIGNIFNLLMWNMGENEEEDEIIEVYFEGCMDEDAMNAWFEGDWQ